MPELPEVEVTMLGLRPHLEGRKVVRVVVRERRLRWPVPPSLERNLPGQTVTRIRRRAKYLLLHTIRGTVLIHLGMSGSLRVISSRSPPGIHDHVDIRFAGGICLRFHDPRRFGAVLFLAGEPESNPLLSSLGPEPLSTAFTGRHLRGRSRGRRLPVKNFIMDHRIVAGVGNIYASEALFSAGIDPRRSAGRISSARYQLLSDSIRAVLRGAIHSGGTTLRDFRNSSGRPGYFQRELHVYGRAGRPCVRCGAPIRRVVIGQRSSFFCCRCQR